MKPSEEADVVARRERIFAAMKAHFESQDLDLYVHELKGQEASDLNNNGLDDQLAYLEEAAGLDWLEDMLAEDTES